MSKLHIKKGDTVKVLSGADNGKTGKITSVDREKRRAFVEGINMVSKHTKPSAANPQGGIVKREASVHISNLGTRASGRALSISLVRVRASRVTGTTRRSRGLVLCREEKQCERICGGDSDGLFDVTNEIRSSSLQKLESSIDSDSIEL